MGKVHLQFHAEPHELLCMLPRWLEGVRVYVAIERFSPQYSVSESSLREICETTDSSAVSRLALALQPITTSVQSGQEFLERNRDVLTILPGTNSQEGLRESLMSTINGDQASLKEWRRVRRRALDSMYRGAVVVNPMTAARADLKDHPFSQGALDLYRQGIPMLALGGWNRYELAEPTPEGGGTARG